MSGAAQPPFAPVAAVPAAAPIAAAPVVTTPRIKSFTLCDFRAFAGPEPVTFNLDGKNLLIYGENGAGKSSVFHALDEFFSVARRGPQARKERLLGLKNVFSGQPDTGLKISVEFDDGKPAAEWTTARHPVDIAPAADDRVKNAAYRKAILDYRSLLETNYRHADGPVNLFDVCINVLLRDFEVLHDGRQRRLFDLWLDVQRILDVAARGRLRLGKRDAPAVRKLLPSINQGLRDALSAILPEIAPMLKCLGWEDIEIVSLTVPGLTYTDKATIPPKDRIETRRVDVELKFRGQSVDRPQLFLNEARLSALALAIYLAGRKICAGPLQVDTPRLIVLDDVLIGLDQSNRLPVIDVLADQFKDWQIVLLTHDRVWFEMARAYQRRHKVDKFWNYARIHSDDDPTKAPVVSFATSSAAADVIADGRNFLKQGHVNAAGNYARIAVELALREFCETKKVLVAYQQLPDKTPASDLLTAAKEFSTTKANGTYDIPLAAIDMYTSILFNKLSHGGVPAVTSHEVQGALNAVDGLLFALKVVPTGTKSPVP
ncbi:MAG TPA: AAA family ATPase [Accumulibacter sp.]|uniref:AAA family ATPase n=1 Tax=Accumulibacter sp. TaxID=2053492 RepID=UPI002BC5B146|nr:AAA family ATPase [Accumulibacter sp.]HRD87324.1 AAA family ATPase [Accumulibacter sp.]